MFVEKNFGFINVLKFSGFHMIWIALWASIVAFVYEYTHWEWMNIPWLPLSVIGVAVAFYIGFKNNQAYDRLWEARKIWGGIVNTSRSWGAMVKGFTGNHFTDSPISDMELQEIRKRLFYRHIGWLYSLRSQLLIPTPWEQINQGKHIQYATKKRMASLGVGLLNCDNTEEHLKQFLPPEEFNRLINYQNTATQIIDQQSQDLKNLREKNII